MTGINWSGVIKGTALAFVVYGAIQAVAIPAMYSSVLARFEEEGIRITRAPAGAMAFWLFGTVLGIFVLVTSYAVARARLGPGPGTAIKVAIAFYLFLAVPAIHNRAMGIPPRFTAGEMAVMLGVIFVSMVAALLAGAWIYTEPSGEVAPKGRSVGA